MRPLKLADSVNSVQSVGGLLFAWFGHLRQVHPLKLHPCNLLESLCCGGGRIPPLLSSAPNESVLICAICGRLSSAAGSVDSVQSVGGLLLARLVHLRQVHPLKMHLCNLWEALLSSRFCEFCAICGRTTVCLVGALETSAPPEIAICRRPSAGAGCVRSFLRSRGRRRRRIPARYTCVR